MAGKGHTLLILAFGLIGCLTLTPAARAECQSASVTGSTTTTVFRCPEQDALAGAPSNMTVVQRGSSEVPWFPAKPLGGKGQSQLAEPKSPPPGALAKIKDDEMEEKPQIAPAKKKAVKTTLAKSKSKKKKVAKKKPAKTKLAKKPGKPAPVQEADNVITWTRQDMTLGQRIGNWLGL